MQERQTLGHETAAPAMGLNEPAALQFAQGMGHGRAAEPAFGLKGIERWEARARAELAFEDSLPQVLLQADAGAVINLAYQHSLD